MANWSEILGWNEEHFAEFRFSGFSFLREGKYEKARLFFEALVLLNSQSIYDRQTLGALYLQMGDNEKALHHLNEALRLDSTDEPTLLNKTKALFMLGQRAEAMVISNALQKSKDVAIAGDASALIIAHR